MPRNLQKISNNERKQPDKENYMLAILFGYVTEKDIDQSMFVTKEEFQLHVYDSNVFIQNIQVLLFNIGQNVLRGGDS